jgi:uncharacterized membrane protein YfhO
MSKEKNLKTASPLITTNYAPNFIDRLGNKGVFLALSIILLIVFFIFRDFITLKKLYLFKDIGSDTLNGAYPFFYNFADYFHSEGLPTWSFQEGMGQNILGGFLRDPFMLIGYFAGPNSMPKIFVFVELLKIICSGVVFYLFLKQLKVSNTAALAGSILYSFSGFMIIGSCWYVFSYEAFTIALTFLGFELFYSKNKWMVFIIAVFAIAVSLPFNLYVVALLLIFYMLFRLGQDGKLTLKNFFVFSLKLAGLGLIGLLLSAPFMFESALQLLESPRGSGANSYADVLKSQPMFKIIDKVQFGTFIMRLFSSDLIGSGNSFKGWQNFLEAPVSYCGTLSLLLMPQVFFLISKNVRKWYIFWLAIWLLPTIFPYFRYAFWLFSGDYYRVFSFCVSLVFIIYTVTALDLILKTRKINIIALAASLISCLGLISYNFFKGSATGTEVDSTISLFIKASLFIYAALIYFSTRNSNPAILYSIIGLMCIEAIFLSSFSVNRRDALLTRELKEKIGYNDYSVEAVDFIKKQSKGFYRIDKNYYSSGAMHGSLNDNKIHGYFGTSSYSSFANNNYINYLKAYNVIAINSENESRWAPGLLNRPILQSLNNVNYIMAKGYSNPVWRGTHDSVAKFGDVLVLKHKFILPFGYTYDSYITQDDFKKLSQNQKDFVSLQSCVINQEDTAGAAALKKYNLVDTLANTQFSFDNYKNDVGKLQSESLKLSSFSQKHISGSVLTTSEKLMYLSFPFDKGWKIKINNNEGKFIYSNGMNAVLLPKGNNLIELNYKPRLFGKGLMLVPIGVLCIVILYIVGKKTKKLSQPTVI